MSTWAQNCAQSYSTWTAPVATNRNVTRDFSSTEGPDLTSIEHRPEAISCGPYALSPDRTREPTTQQPPDAGPVRRSDDGTWTAPFIMAPFNTRIVRRSNALQG
jgi:short subunit dehydrogenase-like uncharacterized protein